VGVQSPLVQRPSVCGPTTRLSATCLPSSSACGRARLSMHLPCTILAERGACSLRTAGRWPIGGARGCGARASHYRQGARLPGPGLVACSTQRVLECAACFQLSLRKAGLRMQI